MHSLPSANSILHRNDRTYDERPAVENVAAGCALRPQQTRFAVHQKEDGQGCERKQIEPNSESVAAQVGIGPLMLTLALLPPDEILVWHVWEGAGLMS